LASRVEVHQHDFEPVNQIGTTLKPWISTTFVKKGTSAYGRAQRRSLPAGRVPSLSSPWTRLPDQLIQHRTPLIGQRKLCRVIALHQIPDWAIDTTGTDEIAQLCLSHKKGTKVERSYRRSTAVGRRRELMEAWAQHVTGQ
jgi:hypothetical protein